MNNGMKDSNGIKDSGERITFRTGAVRDIQEGKGRCDLMPLGVVNELLFAGRNGLVNHRGDPLYLIEMFKVTKNVFFLYSAICSSVEFMFIADDDICDSPFETKMVTLLLEVSKHYEEGAKKYGEYNWQKGIPVSSFINSACRHYLKAFRGDDDERHDLAFVWNLLNCIWTVENLPDMGDIPIIERSVEEC